MTLFDNAKNIINDVEWFRQAAASRAFFLLTPALGVTREFNPPAFFSCVGLNFEGFYPRQQLIKQAQDFLDKSKSDNRLIDDYLAKLYVILKKLDKIFDEIDSLDLKSLDNKELLASLKKFDDLNYEFWFNNWLCDKYDPTGHDMLLKEINLELSSDEIALLTSPTKLNFLELSELDLYNLALELYDQGLDDNVLLKKLNPYAKKYYYVQNSWLVVKVLKSEDFLDGLKQVLSYDKVRIIERIEQIGNKQNNLSNNINHLLKDKEIKKELSNVFYLFRRLAELRDIRKLYVLKINYYNYLYAEEIAKRYDISIDHMLNAVPFDLTHEKLSSQEYKDSLAGDKQVLFIFDDGYTIFRGEEAEKVINNLHSKLLTKFTEIKGRCACQGKVKGVVRVVMNEVHFSKFNNGEILVAPMTRPEYVPLMKKAAAIITDEGGITSHAAVVSRELGVPCVIGTQVATKKLVDGDIVEVDADNGVVRIVE